MDIIANCCPSLNKKRILRIPSHIENTVMRNVCDLDLFYLLLIYFQQCSIISQNGEWQVCNEDSIISDLVMFEEVWMCMHEEAKQTEKIAMAECIFFLNFFLVYVCIFQAAPDNTFKWDSSLVALTVQHSKWTLIMLPKRAAVDGLITLNINFMLDQLNALTLCPLWVQMSSYSIRDIMAVDLSWRLHCTYVDNFVIIYFS